MLYHRRMKIGVFDSGIGGITVLSEIQRQFPGHEFFYFGDTANVPYGTKSVTQIKNLCSYAAARIHEFELDLFIVACNTASSLALVELMQELDPTPVIDVVQAGVATIKSHFIKDHPILILGTKATINSRTYKNRLAPLFPNAEIIEQACPLLVPMIEEGWTDHEILRATVREYVRPFVPQKGTALLACTHYPWIQNIFAQELPGWKILDSAHAVADLLREKFLSELNKKGQESSFAWHFSDPDSVAKFAFKTMLGSTPKLETF